MVGPWEPSASVPHPRALGKRGWEGRGGQGLPGERGRLESSLAQGQGVLGETQGQGHPREAFSGCW